MNIFAWIGTVCAVIFCLSALLGACAWFLSEWRENRYSRKMFLKAAMSREIGGDIHNLSWWFSESREAMLAVQAVANWMMKRGDLQSDLILKEWRQDLLSKRNMPGV